MGILEVIKTFVISFQPPRYRELSAERSKKVFKHLSLIIFLVFVTMVLIQVPKLMSMQSHLEYELGKIKKMEIKGDMQMDEPVFLTGDIVLDTSDTRNIITDEKILVTKDNLYFNFWAPMKIKLEKILKPMNYKSHFASAIAMLVLFLTPSVLVFLLGLLFVKYVLFTLVAGSLGFFILRVLLLTRVRARDVFNVCYLAAIPIVVFEGLGSVLFSRMLVPLAGALTFKLNLLPVLMYITLVVLGLVFAEKDFKVYTPPVKKEDGKQEEKIDWGF